jgi:hypothetical protein
MPLARTPVRRMRRTRLRSGQKPRFLAAIYGVMSGEIAGSNFSQMKNTATFCVEPCSTYKR